jgi:hypothetical protein
MVRLSAYHRYPYGALALCRYNPLSRLRILSISGIIAIGVMSIVMMLATRPARIEPLIGGLGQDESTTRSGRTRIEINEMSLDLCGVGGAPVPWLSDFNPGVNILGWGKVVPIT